MPKSQKLLLAKASGNNTNEINAIGKFSAQSCQIARNDSD